MAMEYATQSGASAESKEEIYIQSLDATDNFTDFKSPLFVFRLVH